jgi:hypothetical protein
MPSATPPFQACAAHLVDRVTADENIPLTVFFRLWYSLFSNLGRLEPILPRRHEGRRDALGFSWFEQRKFL